MTPEEGFESAQFLVGWAHTQIEELKTLIKTLTDSNPATVVKELNQKTRLDEMKVRFPALPHRVRGLSNNIVKDLRDALDQATNAATQVITGKMRRHAHFPFGSSPLDFDKAVTMNMSKDIPIELYPILKSFEPYPTSDQWSGGNDAFRMLGRISGPHKHRVSLSQAVKADSIELSNFTISAGEGAGRIFPNGHTANQNEVVLLALGKGGYANFDLQLSYYIAFTGSKMDGIPVDRFLFANIETVGKVVQDLQSEVARIGPRT